MLEDVRRTQGVAALWSHEETGNGWTYRRDIQVATWARAHGVAWHEIPQSGVQRRLQNRNGWALAWDRRMAEPVIGPPKALTLVSDITSAALPSSRDLQIEDCRFLERQAGGRRTGLTLLESFLGGRGQNYRREMSNPLSGASGCSRLSPHLAWGTVSMRETVQLTWVQMRALKGDTTADARALRASLVSFSGRLHWHCHFVQKLESEPQIEFRELHAALRGLRPEGSDPALFHAWANGQTGYPFFDACMRSLTATGWLNFRMRAMVMSFASYNLWLPWRATGLHLARQFTDYEPGIHWPQTQMQSGTTGINTIRIYSVVKQGHDQDATGAFVRRWVPELDGIPDEHLQEPWNFPGSPLILGKTYPERIVDLKSSAAAAKDRIYGARQGAVFRVGAMAILKKHGSRKHGTEPKAPGPKRSRKSKPNKVVGQTEMDL